MRRLLQFALCMGVLALFLSSASPTVSAGTRRPLGANGQQLAFVPSCDANWAYVSGYNQSNNFVHQWFLVVAASPFNYCEAPSSYDWGWWWKSWNGKQVQVDGWWTKSSGYAGTVYVFVPQWQCCSDWTYVGMP